MRADGQFVGGVSATSASCWLLRFVGRRPDGSTRTNTNNLITLGWRRELWSKSHRRLSVNFDRQTDLFFAGWHMSLLHAGGRLACALHRGPFRDVVAQVSLARVARNDHLDSIEACLLSLFGDAFDNSVALKQNHTKHRSVSGGIPQTFDSVWPTGHAKPPEYVWHNTNGTQPSG